MELTTSTTYVDAVVQSWAMEATMGGVTNIQINNGTAATIGTVTVGELTATNLQDALRELDADINAIADLSVLFENKLI